MKNSLHGQPSFHPLFRFAIPLVLVHVLVRAADDVDDRAVVFRVVHRDAEGHANLFPRIFRRGVDFRHGLGELLQESLPVPERVVLENHGEFVAADAVESPSMRRAWIEIL